MAMPLALALMNADAMKRLLCLCLQYTVFSISSISSLYLYFPNLVYILIVIVFVFVHPAHLLLMNDGAMKRLLWRKACVGQMVKMDFAKPCFNLFYWHPVFVFVFEFVFILFLFICIVCLLWRKAW